MTETTKEFPSLADALISVFGSRTEIAAMTPVSGGDINRDCRLAPQFRDAARWFDATDRKRISYLLEHLDEYLDEPEQPSFLHGNLWSGNFITGSDGNAWLIDPAAYVGHPEADIAMTELFGGFPQKFYDSYQEVNPMKPGYERRREVYNLYHLLNHLNLFGGSYLSSVRRILKNREK